MNYTRQEVLQFVEEEDVKYVYLMFCDIYGNIKSKSISFRELERAFDHGIAIDAWCISGFSVSDTKSDIFLRPEPETLAVLPWRTDDDKAVRMFCSITWPDGRPFEVDTRYILKQAVDEAVARGLGFTFSTEQEFYLFEQNEAGVPSKRPYDTGGYMDMLPLDRSDGIRRDICFNLEKMGIYVESSHHEEGPGQNEIVCRYSNPLEAADNAMSFKLTASVVAQLNGLCADFSPRPLENEPGNGMHVNFAAWNGDGEDLTFRAAAGVMSKIPEMMVFMNPTDESYKRLGKNKAPGYLTWAKENRSHLIRIPAAEGEYIRAELRNPDSCANPYLVISLMIYASIYGIENGIELPDEADLNMIKADREELKKYTELPGRLNEARYSAAASDFIKERIPVPVIAAYVG